MKAMKAIAGLISLFVVAPIWYYLLHYILVKVDAGELQFFLFWVYVPFAIFAGILLKMVDAQSDRREKQ